MLSGIAWWTEKPSVNLRCTKESSEILISPVRTGRPSKKIKNIFGQLLKVATGFLMPWMKIYQKIYRRIGSNPRNGMILALLVRDHVFISNNFRFSCPAGNLHI